MEQHRIQQLLHKYREGTATDEEKAFVESWYAQYHEIGQGNYSPEALLADAAIVHNALQRRIRQGRAKAARWIAATAAIVLLVGGIVIYLNYRHQQMEAMAALPAGPVNQAVLTLPDGKHVKLDPTQSGIVISDLGIKYQNGKSLPDVISNPDKTEKTLQQKDSPQTGLHVQYSILTTPKGGQYQIILEDGTKVWLNVASTLAYPKNFSQNRTLRLSGEAYVEVAERPGQPFRINTSGQTVEVLGTRFNLQAYADEPYEKTALVSGAVKVTAAGKEIRLKPEQQAVLSDGKLTIQEFDPEAMTSWKNGVFRFQNEDIYSIMRQLARWYGVTVNYRGAFSATKFIAGAISRQSSLEQALNMLETLGIARFEVSGNQVTVIGQGK